MLFLPILDYLPYLNSPWLFRPSNTYYTTSVKYYVLIILAFFTFSKGFEEASGVNLTSSEGFGARYFGMGQNFLGLPGDGTSLNFHPAGLAEASQTWVSLGHTQKFWNSSYDDISAVLPLDTVNTIAMGFSRYGAQSFYAEEGSELTQDFTELNVSDYLWVTAFSRRWKSLDLGANLQILLRNLDQKGLGMRGDFSAQYYFLNRYRVAALLQGLIPSNTRWESSYWEYQPSDLYLGAGGQWPIPYFYGNVSLAIQTKGLFQRHSKSSVAEEGGRIYQEPADVFKTSGLAFEYDSYYGISLRMGIAEFRRTFSRMTAAFGLSYNFRDLVRLDYGVQTHESLTASHRISLSMNPFFRTKSNSFVRSKRAPIVKMANKAPQLESKEVKQAPKTPEVHEEQPSQQETGVELEKEREILEPTGEEAKEILLIEDEPEEILEEPEEILEE